MIFNYKAALKSKVGKPVSEEIWILEVMKEYGLSYKQIIEETPVEIYDLMKGKLITERKVSRKITNNFI